MSTPTPSSTNKFAAILKARQEAPVEESATVQVDSAVAPTPASPPTSRAVEAPTAAPTTTATKPATAARTTGRGKSSDPRFKQVTAYIPQDLHENATIALRLTNQVRVDEEKEDFSELLTRLLAQWYQKQTYYRPNK